MKPERWQRVTDLFQSAIGREPDQRAVYLDGVCAGDDSLRQEVEALIAAHEQADSFIEQPAFEIEAATLAADHVGSMVGRALGHYQLISLLGSGGMGEVYLAQDTRLGRKVAVKLLLTLFTTDEPRVRRFRQEAQSASALNHPNIVTIYEVGEVDGLQFIVSELVEGETLRERMARMKEASSPAQDSLNEVLDLAIQVASALAAAHQAGIMHRDIKPENIMLRPDGYVKVLDFGLAKLSEKATDQRPLDSEAATKVLVRTSPGLVMGSAEYMSPEQARGQEVDARTDIWSLGVVLYEMVTGCAPFTGETPTDVIASIVKTELPPLAQTAPEAPAELERIVSKTLAKDREERYQGVKDLLVDLRQLRKRRELAAELERTASPELNVQPTAPSGAQATFRTAQIAATQTGGGVARQTSSAEYVVGQIKQHRAATLLTLIGLAAAIIGLAVYLHARSTEAAIESIAVLPFDNQNHDADSEYLSDGLTESIINNLTQLSNLRVVARNTAFRYKGKATDPIAVGNELGVRAILTGRILQRGDNLLVSAELIDVRDNKQLWGQQYNRKLADAVNIQAEIAKTISDRLRLNLSGEEQKRLAKRPTENPEAYHLYLKGNYYTAKYTKEGLDKGKDYFNQAIAADPTYALAYDGVAYYYITAVGFFLSDNDAMPKLREAANKALAIDETLGEPHNSLAIVNWWFDRDWPSAEKEFKRAIELNQNYARAHWLYGWYLITMGRTDEGIEESKRAQELDPLSLETNTILGQSLFFARRYDQAVAQLRNTLDMDQNFWLAHDFLGRAYEANGKLAEAIAEFQRAVEQEGDVPENWSNLGHAYALSGKRAEAQKILDQLKEQSARSYVPAYTIAMVYAGLGDKDQAFAWLDRAYTERSFYMTWLKTDPHLDNLRADPRFQDLLRRMKLNS